MDCVHSMCTNSHDLVSSREFESDRRQSSLFSNKSDKHGTNRAVSYFAGTTLTRDRASTHRPFTFTTNFPVTELRPDCMTSPSGSSAWKPKSPPENTGPPDSGFWVLCPIAKATNNPKTKPTMRTNRLTMSMPPCVVRRECETHGCLHEAAAKIDAAAGTGIPSFAACIRPVNGIDSGRPEEPPRRRTLRRRAASSLVTLGRLRSGSRRI